MCVHQFWWNQTAVATWTESSGWLHGSRGAIQVRRFRIFSLFFASEVIRNGFSFSWLVTFLSPLWSDMFAICWTILLQVSVLYAHAHRFMVSGFGLCLWCRLDHFRNASTLSLSRCKAQKKQAMNMTTEIHHHQPLGYYTLEDGIFQCIFILLLTADLWIFLCWKWLQQYKCLTSLQAI